MRKLTELSTDSDFEEFSNILSKLHDSHAVITMKQAVQRKDGEYNYVDLQQTVTENRTTVQINGQFVFITLHSQKKEFSEGKNYVEHGFAERHEPVQERRSKRLYLRTGYVSF